MSDSEFALEPTPVLEAKPKRGRPKGSGKKALAAPAVTTAPELELSSDESANYLHRATRLNNPPAGLAAEGKAAEPVRTAYAYNPHRSPTLRFDGTGRADRAAELAALASERQLSASEAEELKALLSVHEPWIEWAGKREVEGFEVDPVALHIHERVSTQAILRAVQRQDLERGLFADPELDPAKELQFYRYPVDWANRMILGDSLQVMASLARRENLAGQVQMIYLDPPYGIKFASNFQPQVGQRDVRDKDSDLTREPEMVRAYRDTWTLGVHSYLAYLRDRLMIAKELLADTGSIFVQISDENLHRVRMVLDEVFGAENFNSLISYVTTSGIPGDSLSRSGDYILWYSRDILKTKYVQLYKNKELGDEGAGEYKYNYLPDGQIVSIQDGVSKIINSNKPFRYGPLTSSGAPKAPTPFEFNGMVYHPSGNNHWKTTTEGLSRLANAGYLISRETSISYFMFLNSYPIQPISNHWLDTKWGFDASEKAFVVQTHTNLT